MSDKHKLNDDDLKYFIGYRNYNNIIILLGLCIALPQMSGYIKYFESGG